MRDSWEVVRGFETSPSIWTVVREGDERTLFCLEYANYGLKNVSLYLEVSLNALYQLLIFVLRGFSPVEKICIINIHDHGKKEDSD